MAVAAVTVLTIVLFAYSLGLRFAHILQDRELRRMKARWWPNFARVLMAEGLDEVGDLQALSSGSRTKLLREWCRFRSQIRGSASNNFNHLAEKLGLLITARRLLGHRSMSGRLLAVQALGFLRDATSWQPIEALLEHQNISMSMTAATALVHIDPQRAIRLIIPMIGKRQSWPRTQVGLMLNLAGPDVVTRPLCRAIETAESDAAIRLLRFFESAHVSDVDSLITKLLATRSDPGLIAAALKSVRGHLPNRLIGQMAIHDAWFVRIQAASLLGRFGRREDYRILEPLLADTEWWVRYRAAQAITKLPFLGPNALRKLRDRQKDRFARDIMCQALAEVGMA